MTFDERMYVFEHQSWKGSARHGDVVHQVYAPCDREAVGNLVRGQRLQGVAECVTVVEYATKVRLVFVFFDDAFLDLEAVADQLRQPVSSEAFCVDDALELLEAGSRPREHELQDLAVP